MWTSKNKNHFGLRVLASLQELWAFQDGIKNVSYLIDGTSDVKDPFLIHLLNDWREYKPSTAMEKKYFSSGETFVFELSSSEQVKAVHLLFYVISILSNDCVFKEEQKSTSIETPSGNGENLDI